MPIRYPGRAFRLEPEGAALLRYLRNAAFMLEPWM